MNSRTVIEEPTAPPSGSSLKISASRAFSAPFLVLAVFCQQSLSRMCIGFCAVRATSLRRFSEHLPA